MVSGVDDGAQGGFEVSSQGVPIFNDSQIELPHLKKENLWYLSMPFVRVFNLFCNECIATCRGKFGLHFGIEIKD